MKKVFIAISGITLLIGLFLWLRSGQAEVIYQENVPEIPLPNEVSSKIVWPREADDVEDAGEASAVAVNSDGDLYYLHRSAAGFADDQIIEDPVVVVIDGETGKVKDKWGTGIFKSPHGMEIDHENRVWVTDISLNKVFTFSSDGQLLQSFGDDYPFYLEPILQMRNELPQTPVSMSETTFARPTDITVFEDGSFAVSDGYRNSRVVKFTENGEVEWEHDRLGNNLQSFYLPHGITHDKEGNIYVADRSNARIQVLNKEGKIIDTWDQPELGRPFGLEVSHDQELYVVSGGNTLYPEGGDGLHQLVKMDLSGQIVERFGVHGEGAGELGLPHDVAVGVKGEVYIAELRNKRVQAFVFED
ncbi:peptidyl-alpha-hydroxyglycine alpha-amidating lyase family protein [Jeotgalibacillus aurantiacus]|uniref:peptidyl-alpha-hydroxyglycine alpha-amidating lyase family protein n=1 Tax=Jeotgalibacillus aurantiacus TaxID=2763266 RepID=UPI001D0A73FD|nr:peptidyl-alpha-hydroxyglycine alpha-amidating lyase family protein [Jeotgalibacillus aurantiacus]